MTDQIPTGVSGVDPYDQYRTPAEPGSTGAMAAGGGHDSGTDYDTWLTEDEDVWGTDDDAAPPVLGG